MRNEEGEPGSPASRNAVRAPLWRRGLRALALLVVVPIALLALVAVLLYVPAVQDLVRGRATAFLSERIGTPVKLDRLALRFPIGLTLQGVYIEDLKGDTLVHAGELQARVAFMGLFVKRIEVTGLSLRDARAHLHQDLDSTFNFQFIVDAFVSDTVEMKEESAPSGWTFAVDGIALRNIHFSTDLQPAQLQLDLRLGELELPLNEFDLDSMRFHAADLHMADVAVQMRSAPSTPAPDTYPDLESLFGDLDLALEHASLERVNFSMATSGRPDSMWLRLVRAQFDVEEMNTRMQRFHLGHMLVDELEYCMVSEAGSDTTVPAEPVWVAHEDGFRYFLRDLNVSAQELVVRGSSFELHEDAVTRPSAVFDPSHLVVRRISATLRDLVANNDTLAINVERLDGALAADLPFALAADVRATPAEFSVAHARVAWQDLTAAFSLRAQQGSLQRAYRTPAQVPFQARLETAIPVEHQQQVFALLPPDLLPVRSIPEGFDLAAYMAGTLDRSDTIAVDVQGDAGTTLRARGAVNHAMDMESMVFDVRLEPFTMGAGARAIAKAYAKDATIFPKQLTVTTSVSGDPTNIKADLVLRSDLADVQGSMQARGWRKDMPDAFTADMKAKSIALQRFLGDTAWRDADVTIHAEARGLNSAQREGWLEFVPQRLQHGDTDLSDTYLRAEVKADSIHATLTADSEPLMLALDADGRWPAQNDSLSAQVDLSIQRADLFALGLTANELAVIGNWRGDLALDTGMHGRFTLEMDSTRLESGSERFLFEELRAQAYLGADSTSAIIRSDAMDLSFDANIGLDTLLVRATEKARGFLSTDTTYHIVDGERLEFSLDLKRTEWLTDMLVPGLHAIELEKLEAHYDGSNDELRADLVLPYLLYDSLEVRSTTLAVDAQGSAIKASLSSDRIAQGRYAIEGLAVDASGSGGDLSAGLRVTKDEVDRYRIGMDAQQKEDGLLLRMKPDLVLDGRDWKVHEENSLLLADDRAVANNMVLSDSAQRITFLTPEDALNITFDGFRIATLANIISTPDTFPVADGGITGELDLAMVPGGRSTADITVEDLHLLNTELGTLDVDFAGTGAEQYQGRASLSRTSNRLDAKVDKTPDRMHAMATLDLADIRFLEPFVSEYLYDPSGGVDGAVEYRDQGGRTSITGRMHFEQAQVGVVMTGATYTMADETLALTDAGMHFDAFDLQDSLGNAFRVDGDILTATDRDARLDLRVRTDRFQLVNSTLEQNPQFFGDLFARIDLQAKGIATRPTVQGEVGILDGTRFSVVLPGSTVELVSSEGIVVFTDDLYAVDTLALNGDAAALRDSLEALLPGVELDLHITVDKEADFAIVLDPAAGDQATVSGAADLTFRYAPDAPMYLNGQFAVERGEYTLDLYGLVKKRFELVKGGTVRWTGDPVQAEMDLQARYRSETAPYALVATGNSMLDVERNRLQQPLPFDVLININGSMSAPDIGFGIDLDRQVRNTFPKVSDKLNQLAQQGNAEELNRQVFGLLVLNSFIQDEGNGGEPSSGIATSAARNSVNGLLTDQMNKLTGRYLKGVDISLGVNTYDQVSGQSNYQRTSLDYRVSKRVLNDRLSFEVGGSVGVDEQNSQVSNVSNTRAAQYAILYDLTADGRFRIRGFHENAYDLYDGEITNSGVAIMFTKDFEENERARASGRKAAQEVKEAQDKKDSDRSRPADDKPLDE